MKSNTNLLSLLVLLITSFLIISCAKDDDDNGRRDEGSYDISIVSESGDTLSRLIGENVGTNWDPELLFVFLSTDAENLPTGTLTLNIIEPSQSMASISTAFLTSSDKLVGTGEELNARAYATRESDMQRLSNVVVGGNYISADLENIIMFDEETDEEVSVSGSFVAINQ